MKESRLAAVVQHLQAAALRDGVGLSDGQLLQRYLSYREEAAFAALVRRHGGMVLGVCRRLLRDMHDAEDAFQATFLVLVRKAHSIKPRQRVGPWLYGVAYRTALKAKAVAGRRRAREKPLQDVPAPPTPEGREWLAVLDHEVNRLPEKYRAVLVLCDLEGRTRKEAAKIFDWPEGTVATRLRQARSLIQKRLVEQGLTLAGVALGAAWPQGLSAAVPLALRASAIRYACLFAARDRSGLVPAKIIALTEGVLKAMMFTKAKTVSLLLVIVAVIGLGLSVGGGAARLVAGGQSPDGDPAPGVETRPAKPVDPLFVTRFVDSGTIEENDGLLPTGPAPVQALVSFDGNKFVVRTNESVRVPRTIQKGGKIVQDFFAEHRLHAERYDRADVEAFDTQLRRLDLKKIAGWLKAEIPALVLVGTREVDVLHFRFIKEGTLLFVVRIDPHVAVGAQFPVPSPPAPSVRKANIDLAARDLNIGKFYQQTGHLDSAFFYYELVRRRYPNTTFSQMATQLKNELWEKIQQSKPTRKSRRIGQIIIVGNEHLPDAIIRERLDIYPGAALDFPKIREAEERLNQIKEPIKVRASIVVLDPESPKEYQDLLVKISEIVPSALARDMNKLGGAWVVLSAALDGAKLSSLTGAEIVFSGSEMTATANAQTSKQTILLNPASKEIRWFPLEGPESAQPRTGTYEFRGENLHLRVAFPGRAMMVIILKRKNSQQRP